MDMPSNAFSPDQAKDLATAEVAHGVEKVDKAIDKLSSSNLKRVLKTVCHVHAGEQLLGRHVKPLKEEEQDLIDIIFALQESVLGYAQLMEEIKTSNNGLAFTNKETNDE